MSDWREKLAERNKEGARKKEEEELKKLQDLVRKAVEKEREKDRGDDVWLIVRSDTKFDEPDEVPNEKL